MLPLRLNIANCAFSRPSLTGHWCKPPGQGTLTGEGDYHARLQGTHATAIDELMRIAVLSPMINPLAEPFAGGTEAVTAQIARGLAGRGHAVTVFATEGSGVPGTELRTMGLKPSALRWLAPPDQLDGATMRALLVAEQRAFHGILLWLRAHAAKYDLVHNNSFSGTPLLLADSVGVPFVTTLHVPPVLLEQVAALRTLAENGTPSRLIAVSHGLAQEFGTITPVGKVIHNGVEIPADSEVAPDQHLLFVGRLVPEKGADLAISIARAAGCTLLIAGRIEDDAFYRREIVPHVDGTSVIYLGHLSQGEVWSHMSRAAAMLFTPRWPEPCSLAVLEGLSRGTPAIAFATGGLVEQVIDGETGFLVPPGDLTAAAGAIAKLGQVSREACRADMVQRFSRDAMVSKYEAYFQKIIEGARPSQGG
jgi:UDP-glucose:tetrahydrobiopterin glucosyltransferase